MWQIIANKTVKATRDLNLTQQVLTTRYPVIDVYSSGLHFLSLDLSCCLDQRSSLLNDRNLRGLRSLHISHLICLVKKMYETKQVDSFTKLNSFCLLCVFHQRTETKKNPEDLVILVGHSFNDPFRNDVLRAVIQTFLQLRENERVRTRKKWKKIATHSYRGALINRLI